MVKFRVGRLTHHQTLMPEVFKHLPDWQPLLLLYCCSRGSRAFLLKDHLKSLKHHKPKLWDLLWLLTGLSAPFPVDFATAHSDTLILGFETLLLRITKSLTFRV